MTHLRCIFLIVVLIAAMTGSWCLASGTPKKISYQGKATDPSGNAVTDGNHAFVFSLYDHPTAGTQRWTESATAATVGGLFNHALGSVTPIPDSLFARYDSLYLRVSFDGQVITPRTPIVSAGYAMRVNSVDGAKGGYIDGATYWMDTTVGEVFGVMRSDASANGAGYFEVRKDGGVSGFTVEGNYAGTGQPYVSLNGTDRDIILNTSVAGSSSVRLPSSAVDASEMKDEPGVGSYLNQAGYVVSSGIVYLGGRTMMAPSDGYVLVIATAEISGFHTFGQVDAFYFGVADNNDSLHTATKVLCRIGQASPSDYFYQPITVHGLFPIDSGSHAYYFLSQHGSGSCYVENIMITELFVPTAYTTVVTPASASPGPAGGASTSHSYDPVAERLEAEAFHKKQVDDELAKIKAEIDLLKRQMEEKSER